MDCVRDGFPSRSGLAASAPVVLEAWMAIKICSAVAGMLRLGGRSLFKYDSAFFAASHALIPSSKGGSPRALLRYKLTSLLGLSSKRRLKISGRSLIAGILYVVGECERSSPVADQTSS